MNDAALVLPIDDSLPNRHEFLQALYGDEASGHLVLWRRSGSQSRWLSASDLAATSLADGMHDVYFGVALQGQADALRLAGTSDPSKTRGRAESALALPGLWADLDIAGPAHKSAKLPRSMGEVSQFLDAFPAPPTAVVHSGYGAQAWWLFPELWVFDEPCERDQAAALSLRFNATLQAWAVERGWQFDNTSDLARVLRLPGTVNGKLGHGVPLQVIDWHPERRYDVSAFEHFLIAEQLQGSSERPPVDTEAVLSGIAEGQRDTELFRLACKFRHADVPREAATDLVLAAARKCVPPFPEREARAKIASAYKYQPGSGSSPPERGLQGSNEAESDRVNVAMDAALCGLEGIEAPVDLSDVERLLTGLREAASMVDPLKRAVVRERALAALKGKVQSPARLVDVALQGGEIAPPDRQGSGSAVSLEMAEPWSEPVDGASLLDEIRAALRSYVILPEGAATAMAPWVVHTYAFDTGMITPRLAITSPVKRCAKTLVLTMLEQFVNKPLLTANVTAAALFRVIEHSQPTLLIDEADTFFQSKDDLRGVLNSGHRNNGTVLRVAGDDHEPRQFSTFAPVAIAKIGGLPDTLADRSIAIEMRRKAEGESVTSLRLDKLDHFKPIRQRCARWALDHRDHLGGIEPMVPSGLNDRAADNWRPLLAIAEHIDGEWPERAWRAVGYLSIERGDDAASVREDLLADIRAVFDRRDLDALFTDQLLSELHGMEERPWPEWRKGKPMSAVQLARLLRDFKVKPQSVRIGQATRKGYKRADFEEAFGRYLPSETSHPSQSSNSGALRDSSTRHTAPSVTPRESPQTPANSGTVTGVTPQNPDTSGWTEV